MISGLTFTGSRFIFEWNIHANEMNQNRKILSFLKKRRFEILLFALLQHLYIGVFLQDVDFYSRIIWPVNMGILGIASIGVFLEKGKWKTLIQLLLFIPVIGIPIAQPFVGVNALFMEITSLLYTLFFAFIFFEVTRFLAKPSYINIDIISASTCGYLLLIEITAFIMQYMFYNSPSSFTNLDTSSPAAVYMDLVYFSTIIQTTIGFGDITPTLHRTELAAAALGVAGHLYTVMLVGIIISKFTMISEQKRIRNQMEKEK